VQIVDFIRISVVPIVAGREVPALPIAAHLAGYLQTGAQKIAHLRFEPSPRFGHCSINPKVSVLSGVLQVISTATKGG
jgi:hypothetical protein